MAPKLSPVQMKIGQPYLDQLKALYAAMDQKYNQVADAYGFICQACQDNCCLTRFYHHTYLEYFYLLMGLQELPDVRQQEIGRRAVKAAKQHAAAEAGGSQSRIMCPLNHFGRCVLYRFRPMICRLHGVPHVVERPDGQRMFGPGCEAFTSSSQAKPPVYLDRTPFYRRLAALEKDLRKALPIEAKFKRTIAQMII